MIPSSKDAERTLATQSVSLLKAAASVSPGNLLDTQKFRSQPHLLDQNLHPTYGIQIHGKIWEALGRIKCDYAGKNLPQRPAHHKCHTREFWCFYCYLERGLNWSATASLCDLKLVPWLCWGLGVSISHLSNKTLCGSSDKNVWESALQMQKA